MSDTGAEPVAAECRLFTRYLSGADASPYVVESYARLLPSAAVSERSAARLIERSLLALARSGALPARIADSYARVFLPRSVLRRRLLLLLAILENSPTHSRPLNSGLVASMAGVVWRLGVTGLASGVCLALGVALFAPVHLLSGAPDASPVSGH